MPRLTIIPAFLVVTLALPAGTQAGGQVKKQPVPDSKAQAKAENLVNDIFKEEINNAKDAEARTKLAVYLMGQGDESGEDPADRYVLYRVARDLAVQAGDTKLAHSAIDMYVSSSEVTSLVLKADAT